MVRSFWGGLSASSCGVFSRKPSNGMSHLLVIKTRLCSTAIADPSG